MEVHVSSAALLEIKNALRDFQKAEHIALGEYRSAIDSLHAEWDDPHYDRLQLSCQAMGAAEEELETSVQSFIATIEKKLALIEQLQKHTV